MSAISFHVQNRTLRITYLHIMLILIFNNFHYRFCTFQSEVTLHRRQRVKRDLLRMRQKKRKQSHDARFDSSSLSTISIMEKYTLGDSQSLVTAIPTLLSAPKYVPRPNMWNPYAFKNSIESKIPSKAYEEFAPTNIPLKIDVQNEGTPDSGCGEVILKSNTTARRRLFASNETSISRFNSPDDRVAEWVSTIDPIHGSDLEYDSTSTVVPDEKFGFTLPSWLQSETAQPTLSRDTYSRRQVTVCGQMQPQSS